MPRPPAFFPDPQKAVDFRYITRCFPAAGAQRFHPLLEKGGKASQTVDESGQTAGRGRCCGGRLPLGLFFQCFDQQPPDLFVAEAGHEILDAVGRQGFGQCDFLNSGGGRTLRRSSDRRGRRTRHHEPDQQEQNRERRGSEG